jgi:hypothetical protein
MKLVALAEVKLEVFPFFRIAGHNVSIHTLTFFIERRVVYVMKPPPVAEEQDEAAWIFSIMSREYEPLEWDPKEMAFVHAGEDGDRTVPSDLLEQHLALVSKAVMDRRGE